MIRVTFRSGLAGLATLASVSLAACQAPVARAVASDSAAAEHFEQFKALDGEWYILDEGGQPAGIGVIYEVTAGGNTVLETVFPGQEAEMMTMYYMDAGDLVLKHYCMVGNQPEMKAVEVAEAGTVRFEYTGGTNLDWKTDGHMHTAEFTFMGADKLQSEWIFFEDGESNGEPYVSLFVRR